MTIQCSTALKLSLQQGNGPVCAAYGVSSSQEWQIKYCVQLRRILKHLCVTSLAFLLGLKMKSLKYKLKHAWNSPGKFPGLLIISLLLRHDAKEASLHPSVPRKGTATPMPDLSTQARMFLVSAFHLSLASLYLFMLSTVPIFPFHSHLYLSVTPQLFLEPLIEISRESDVKLGTQIIIISFCYKS